MSQINLALGAIKWIAGLVQRRKPGSTDSLVSFTRSMRVEPITMIDRRLESVSYMPDIMQSLSAVFSAYYLQAVAAMTNVRDINVIRVLEQLNPNRDVKNTLAANIVDMVNTSAKVAGLESLRSNDYTMRNLQHAGISVESISKLISGADKVLDEKFDDLNREAAEERIKEAERNKDMRTSADTRILREAVNLSVGRMLEVHVGDKKSGATFPIAVRLIATFMDPNTLVHILGDGSRNTTFRERFHSWRGGEIEFWRDLVLAQDLIDAHKKALLRDKSGVYAEIMQRRAGNAASAKISGDPSIGTASNIMVLSRRTVQELEREIGGRFDNAATRERIFRSNYAMLTAVVDTDREIVDIYIRNIGLPSRISAREMKQVSRGDGINISEVFRSLMQNTAPTL